MKRTRAIQILAIITVCVGALVAMKAGAGLGRWSPGVAGKAAPSTSAEIVSFSNGTTELRGLLYMPEGDGPFPAILFNHGSAAGLLNNQAFEAIAPVFLERGWAFFAPYRRGQGLSEDAGPYIMDQIAAARGRGGADEAAKTLADLLSTEQLGDQLAAYAWLQAETRIRAESIAVMGNSFGGIESILGAAEVDYCAVVDAAGGADSWDDAPALRSLMQDAASRISVPVFFFQARNDYDVAPSRTLHAEREKLGLPSRLQIYPPFGNSRAEGHSLPYRGVSVWAADVVAFVEEHCTR